MKYLTLVFLLIGCYSRNDLSPIHNRVHSINKDQCFYNSIFESQFDKHYIRCFDVKPYKEFNYNNLDTCYYNSNDTIYTYPCIRK